MLSPFLSWLLIYSCCRSQGIVTSRSSRLPERLALWPSTSWQPMESFILSTLSSDLKIILLNLRNNQKKLFNNDMCLISKCSADKSISELVDFLNSWSRATTGRRGSSRPTRHAASRHAATWHTTWGSTWKTVNMEFQLLSKISTHLLLPGRGSE